MFFIKFKNIFVRVKRQVQANRGNIALQMPLPQDWKDKSKEPIEFSQFPIKTEDKNKQEEPIDYSQFAIKTIRGYTGMRQEMLGGLPDLKEVLDVGYTDKKSKNHERRKRHYLGENKWPETSDGELKNTIDNYAERNAEVGHVLLGLLSEALVGSGDLFNETFGSDALQVQRLTRYPASAEIPDRKEGEIGSGVHTDYGGLTLLHADGPGLAVLKPDLSSNSSLAGTFSPELEFPHSEEWLEVESRPGTLIAMAGEALQILSHGRILAAKHKVDLPPHLQRHSLAFFLDPRPDALLQPLPELKRADRPAYKAKLAGHKGVVKH